jgi:hypothetical protein
MTELAREALKLLAAEDERQSKLHELLETIREQIRLEIAPEHRPEGLFKNIQDAVYVMRGRTALMNDAVIVAALSALPAPAPAAEEVTASEEQIARLLYKSRGMFDDETIDLHFDWFHRDQTASAESRQSIVICFRDARTLLADLHITAKAKEGK